MRWFGFVPPAAAWLRCTTAWAAVPSSWLGAARVARAFDRRVAGTDVTFDVADPSHLTLTEPGDRIDMESARGGHRRAADERATHAGRARWTLFWFSCSVYYPSTCILAP